MGFKTGHEWRIADGHTKPSNVIQSPSSYAHAVEAILLNETPAYRDQRRAGRSRVIRHLRDPSLA